MKFLNIAPKSIYYLSVTAHITPMVIYAYLFPNLIQSLEVTIKFLIMGITSIFFLWFLFGFMNKFIFLKIDTEEKLVIYGSILFSNEASYEQVNSVRKKLGGFLFEISINSKKYYFIAPDLDVKNLLMVLGG